MAFYQDDPNLHETFYGPASPRKTLHEHHHHDEYDHRAHDNCTPKVVTGSRTGGVSVWDLHHLTCLKTTSYDCKTTKEKSISALAVYYSSAEKKLQIVIGGGGINTAYVLIWTLNDSNDKPEILFNHEKGINHKKAISGITIIPPKDCARSVTYLILASQDRTVTIWDHLRRVILTKLNKEHTDLLLTLSVYDKDNDGLHIITGSWDKSVLFWKVNPETEQSSATPYYKLQAHRKSVTAMCLHTIQQKGDFNHFSKTVLITGSLDKQVIIWDFQTKTAVRTLKGHKDKVNALSVYQSSDHPYFPSVLSASEDCMILIWDLASGNCIREIQFADRVSAMIAFETRYGLVIASGGPKGATLTNLGKTETVKKITTSPVTAVAVYDPCNHKNSPFEGPVIVIGTIDSTCAVFDARSHKFLEQFKLHTSRINALVIYSPTNPEENPCVVSCDGKAKIIAWDLFTGKRKRAFSAKVAPQKEGDPEIPLHDGAVLTLGLFDPALLSSRSRERLPPSANRPMIIAGGTDSHLSVWDLRDATKVSHYLKAHGSFVRSIFVHHPQDDSDPYFLTGSYDKTVKVWSFATFQPLYTIDEGVHKGYVFFISLYDPVPHLGLDLSKPIPDNFKHINADLVKSPSLITSSYDFTLAVWTLKANLEEKEQRLVHHLKDGHIDSVTALHVYVPSTKDKHPLIISGSIDRMVIIWDLFLGTPIQKLVGHTDRVCFITSYTPRNDQKNPIVLSGSDDRTTIVWEDALHQNSFMPTRDDINRCFESDCSEEDWPLITNLVKKYQSKIFYENPHLFFMAIYYNRPNFLLKFRKYLSLILPAIKSYDNWDLLSYAVEKNDLISVRVILLCWTENLNKDIFDILTQKVYHASYFFPPEQLLSLANKYPVEFQNFIICLRLVRNHYSLLLKEDDYHKSYEAYDHKTAVFFDDDQDDNDNKNDHEGDDENEHREQKDGKDGGIVGEISLALEGMGNALSDLLSPVKMTAIVPETTTVSPRSMGKRANSVANKDSSRALMKEPKDFDKFSSPEMNQRELLLHPLHRYEIEGSDHRTPHFDSIWKYKFESPKSLYTWMYNVYYRITGERPSYQPVTTLMVPLKDTAKLNESLKLFVKISRQLDSVDIFDSEIGMVSLRYFWDRHAKKHHIVATVRYMIFLVLYITSIYVFENFYIKDKFNTAEKICMHILNAVVFAGFWYYAYEEFRQITFKKALKKVKVGYLLLHFFSMIWNLIDGVILVTGITGFIIRFVTGTHTVQARCFLALCSVCMWFKVLYFMRPFANSGPLVTMIIHIAYDIRFYLLVLFCVMSGFTQAFWLLCAGDDTLLWGTVRGAFLTTFFYMLGQGVTPPEGLIANDLATLLLVCFMMIMIILMLNLLIALMGDAFAKVRSQGLAVWRQEQASIIIEEAFLLPKTLVTPPYLHVLKYASDVKDAPENDENLLFTLVQQSKKNVPPFTELEEEKEEESAK